MPEQQIVRYDCACPGKPHDCKCGAQVVIEGELCRYCRSGHAHAFRSPTVFRFRPHVNHSLTPEAAARHGLQRTEDGGTYIPTEKKLDEYLAVEKDHGRHAAWKEH